MRPSKKILFFGNERLATGVTSDTPIIKALVLNGYEVVAVVTTPDKSTNPSRKPRLSEIAAQAEQFGIPLLELDQLKPAVEQLRQFGAEAGVLAAFGKMVPQSIIDLFPYGIINLHPSLLPAHRGPTPIESTILSGDQQTGISLMQLVSEMDAGPLFDQVVVELHGNESKQELADQLGKLGAERLIAVLPTILAGEAKPLAQTGPVSYDKRLEASFASLDLKLPAITLERQIRAFKGWPRSRTIINGQPVVVTAAHLEAGAQQPGQFKAIDGLLSLGTIDGQLIIDQLIPAGGKEMSGQAYLLGHPL